MKINPINNNYQSSNTNFKGSVDKSVVKYLKEFQKDALSKSTPVKWETAEIENLTSKLPVILNSLKEFMAQLHSDTKLIVREKGDKRFFRLHNTKLNTELNGLANSDSREQFKYWGAFNARIFPKTWMKQWRDVKEFERLESLVQCLVKKDPAELDKSIFKKYLSNITDDTNKKGLFKDYFLNKRLKKAQECSNEFGIENIYSDKVNPKLRAYKDLQDDYNKRKMAEENLKNVKL